MTYKPCTTAQYRIMEYLRETFETSLCLIYPSRPNAMVLEDQFGEKLEFFFRDGKILAEVKRTETDGKVEEI